MQKTIIIFGATGLIGSYLLRDLKQRNYNVVAVNRSNKDADYYRKHNIPFFIVDITKPEDFEKLPEYENAVVVFMAGYLPAGMSGYNPHKYFEVNTLGALNMLEYCRKSGVKQVIYPQSHSDVAGHWGTGVISPYAAPSLNYNNDHTVYVISKLAAQELIKHYHCKYGLSYCIFRCPNIYAWHPDEYYYLDGKQKVIAYRRLIRQAMASEDIEIWGNCHVPRDIVYIKDFMQMIRLAIEKEIDAAIYNVSTGVSTTLEEQIKTIIEVFSPSDKPSKIIYRPDIEILEMNQQYSIENAVQELGYRPQYFCREMFEDMKQEMQNQQEQQ